MTLSRQALVTANGLGLAASAALAVVGVGRPGFSTSRRDDGSLARFWSASSGVRTWGLLAGLISSSLRAGEPSADLLEVAGLVQLGDAALGVWQRNAGMTVLPALMGVVHLQTARILRGEKLDRSVRRQRPRRAAGRSRVPHLG